MGELPPDDVVHDLTGLVDLGARPPQRGRQRVPEDLGRLQVDILGRDDDVDPADQLHGHEVQGDRPQGHGRGALETGRARRAGGRGGQAEPQYRLGGLVDDQLLVALAETLDADAVYGGGSLPALADRPVAGAGDQPEGVLGRAREIAPAQFGDRPADELLHGRGPVRLGQRPYLRLPAHDAAERHRGVEGVQPGVPQSGEASFPQRPEVGDELIVGWRLHGSSVGAMWSWMG